MKRPLCAQQTFVVASWTRPACVVKSSVKYDTSWLGSALSPVNHKGLHQGWTQTSLYFQVIHFTSRHTKSLLFLYKFLACFHSMGTQHGNLHPAGWPILFCGPTQEPVLATANTRKIGRGFRKNAGEWIGRVEISKIETPGSKRSMYGYMLMTYSRL